MTPRTVSGHTMNPIGRLPVNITLGMATQKDDLHIHPDVKGLLLSWKASKHLRILPAHYPASIEKQPSGSSLTTGPTPPRPHSVTSEDLMSDFPSVFDGQVKAMEGERFHIILTNDAKPFCVKTPRQIPFAYRDKLRAELTTLQEQGIIMPVTHPTEWCAPIVLREHQHVRRSITLKPIREERTVSVSHNRSSGRRHHRRRCQDLHEDGREEGIPSMPTRRRKPGPHHVYHTLRFQIPSSPVRHLVHLRALQQTHG